MSLVCQLIGHRRSRRDARPLGNHRWRSVCRHCRAPMVRVGPKLWKVVAAGSYELEEEVASLFLRADGAAARCAAVEARDRPLGG